ncbi:MAG: AAA family ATPase [Caldilineaceae bacterium]
MVREQGGSGDISGSLLYMAPEVLLEAGSTSRLIYAIGVLAYEMFVGRHPFHDADFSRFLDNVLAHEPDLTPLTAQPHWQPFAAILQRLLAKQPEARYPTAEAVIVALRGALGEPPPPESTAIRESFLQAATFVGREQEMAQLIHALEQALAGLGSAWLVGGESGVGKSRLLDELRTHALVAGALVVRGQAVEGGGLPYQIWREPLRWLVLSTPISDLEASVLKPIVPDIATLLACDIVDAPLMNATESRQRLVWVISELIRRQTQPLTLLFEDLQWAEESLSLLTEVVRLTTDRPLFLVGAYRSEERPQLPNEVPGVQRLQLGRLPSPAIAQLSRSMLGESGGLPRIVNLIERETEGNTFFMVEVVRALAEESGGLAGIGEVTLPAQIFTGGVQRLVARRLQQVSAADFPLLQLAAVMGRKIDLAALRVALSSVTTPSDLAGWLLRCADVAVLEVQGEEWRFVHDKLREGVLRQFSDEQRRHYHRQAATCIRQAYAADLASHASRLVEHYRQMEEVEQECHYAQLAGDYAAQTFVYAEALRYYSHALALTSDVRKRFTLLLAREEILDWRGEWAAQAADLDELAQIAEQLADDQMQIKVMLRQVRQAQSLGNLGVICPLAQQALALAQRIGDTTAEVTVRLYWTDALYRQSDFAAARAQVAPALTLAQAVGLPGLTIDCLLQLAKLADAQGDSDGGLRLYQQALQLCRDSGDRRRELTALNSIGVSLALANDEATADHYVEQSLHLSRALGRIHTQSLALLNLAVSARRQGNYDLAEQRNSEALHLARLMHNRLHECYVLANQGRIFSEMGDFVGAQHVLTQALQLSRSLGAPEDEAMDLTWSSNVALALEQVALAEEYACAAIQVAQKSDLFFEQCRAWAALGAAKLHQGDLLAADQAYQTALTRVAQQRNQPVTQLAIEGLARVSLAQNQLDQAQAYVDELLAWQATHPLTTFYEPALTYLTCYRLLARQQSPRAEEVLEAGHQLLQRHASTISDPASRQRYEQRVRANRELIATWQERKNLYE